VIHHSSKRVNRVKPWVLILGIVVVIGLDLGFTTLIGNQLAPSVATDSTIAKRMNGVNNKLQPAVSDSVEPAISDDDINDVPSRSPSTSRRMSAPTTSTTSTRQQYMAKSLAPVEAAMFTPRVILIPRSQPLTLSTQTSTDRPANYPSAGGAYFVKVSEGPETRAVEARIMSVARERKKDSSLISKALSVIKKPWQGIKAVASKFR